MATITNIDDALLGWVPTQPSLIAVLGTDGTGAVAAYPGVLPEYAQDVLPNVVWKTMSSYDPAPTHTGPSGLFVGNYEFTCRAKDSLQTAQLVARTLIALLNCKKVTISGYTFGPCFLQRANLREVYNEDQAVYLTNMEWKIYDIG